MNFRKSLQITRDVNSFSSSETELFRLPPSPPVGVDRANGYGSGSARDRKEDCRVQEGWRSRALPALRLVPEERRGCRRRHKFGLALS